MSEDALKLTVYFGEADRCGGHLLSDELIARYHEHSFETAILLRGIEGFGHKHQLHTQRLLTLSEDLPLVAVAVDTRERIEAALSDVSGLVSGGLITLERARLLRGELGATRLDEATKLTVYLGRAERSGGRPTYVQVVELLHAQGLDGAAVIIGVDGLMHTERQRARFFSRNADVPLMVVSIGTGDAIAGVLPLLGHLLARPLVTLERVRVCKRDGEHLAEPHRFPAEDESGLGIWQKLTVHANEQARHEGHPLSIRLVHRLREAGAGGATSVRGIRGFSGGQQPHGDRLLELRRRVPVVTTVVDTPERIREWWQIVDELTSEAGLVTSELVPAFRAVGPQGTTGGLRLARLRRYPE